ncbi:MAG TPA: DUF4267 domain-containing protein [Solirubrobacterales bacterium]|nr:DUF4267 domain-containing protein [Solirubrobacterales bacterium]
MVRRSRRAKMDRKARQVALQIGASRVAMGVGIFLVTQPALRALRFGSTDRQGEALAKLGGGRDIAIGALTLAARNDPRALRTTILVSSACDVADAVALGVSARHPETRKAGIGGVLSGGIAAVSGLWAWRRLGA